MLIFTSLYIEQFMPPLTELPNILPIKGKAVFKPPFLLFLSIITSSNLRLIYQTLSPYYGKYVWEYHA